MTTARATHAPFAASFASRILFIKDGKIGNQLVKADQSRKRKQSDIFILNKFSLKISRLRSSSFI
ncbi:hypothetical protein F5ESL0233_00720 [Lactobacillus sp. ESL0233]|nr:hypothetical protein F5ESL0233_00720 [Lactobacillus sp. ESL0233]